MEADGLLSLDASAPYQSSLPLALSSTQPAYHMHPFSLMQQQLATVNVLRHRHALLRSVSLPHLPPPPDAGGAATPLPPVQSSPQGKADRESVDLVDGDGDMDVDGGDSAGVRAGVGDPEGMAEARSVLDLTDM